MIIKINNPFLIFNYNSNKEIFINLTNFNYMQHSLLFFQLGSFKIQLCMIIFINHIKHILYFKYGHGNILSVSGFYYKLHYDIDNIHIKYIPDYHPFHSVCNNTLKIIL